MKKLIYLLFTAIGCLFYGCKSPSTITHQPLAVSHQPIQTIDLPVFIPDSVLQKQLYQALFVAGNGRYYPCVQPGCDPKFKDIYLENPVICVSGNLISVKIHISGNTHLAFLNPGISENITLTARPQVQNDTLYFRDIKMEHSSQNLLVNLTSSLFKNLVEQKIQQYAWFSFRPELNVITNQLKSQFPVKWGGAVLLLNLNAIHLKSVTTQQLPNEGVILDFSADLEMEDSSFAQ